jgi:hypothetical protein
MINGTQTWVTTSMLPLKGPISGHVGSLSSVNEGQASRALLDKFHREEEWVDRKHIHSLPQLERSKWTSHDIYSQLEADHVRRKG